MNTLSPQSKTCFTLHETHCLLRHITSSRRRGAFCYDIELRAFAEPALSTVEDAGWVVLSSQNLGYDFALHKIKFSLKGKSSGREVVEIFLSNRGERKYQFYKSAPDVLHAMNEVDSLYYQAAANHLP